MNKKKLFSVTLIISAAVLIAAAQTKKAPRRIVFARGETVARSTGYMRGIRSEAWFVLRLSARQHIRVEIGGNGSTRGVLIWPSGKQDGGPGGGIYDGDVYETGDYQIGVGGSMVGGCRRG